MKRTFHDVSLRLIKLSNLVLMGIPFFVGWSLYYSKRIYNTPLQTLGNLSILFLFAVLYFLFGRTYDAFLVSLNRISEMIYSQALAAFFSDGIMYIILCLLYRNLPNIIPLVLIFAGQLVMSVVWSYLAHKWYFAVFPAKRTVIIYDMREGMEELIHSYGLEVKFEVLEVCQAGKCIEEDLEPIRRNRAEAVYLCGVHSHDRNIILKYCVQNRITVYVIPRIGDLIMSSASRMHMFHLPILRVDGYRPAPEYLVIKRAFDIVASLLGIILTSPIMIGTAIAIKRTDGGPVLYKQVRLTQGGREFKVWKFRSMRVDAEKDGVARLSTGENDSRITPVGRLIRAVRIDELPQLFNILEGSMSIVGPRPERPEIASQYEKELPEFALRLQAKAGLTGFAQVYGKYNTTPYDKLQMDLMYIAHPSILEDMRIIFATIKILFMPESTEGISSGQTTAMEGDKE